MNIDQKAEIMKRYPAITNMISGMPEAIWTGSRVVKLQKGEMLIEHGGQVTHVYLLCSGTAVISNPAISGNEMRIVFVKEGNTIGEMEALASGTNTRYNARAYTPCDVIVLSVKSFLDWIDNDPPACRIMAEVLAKKLYDASTEVSEYARYDAIVRVATLIYTEKCGRLTMTRQEFAETCGVSVRTINRCLNRLKNEKLISITRGKIFVTAKQNELLSNSPYNFYNFKN